MQSIRAKRRLHGGDSTRTDANAFACKHSPAAALTLCNIEVQGKGVGGSGVCGQEAAYIISTNFLFLAQ